MKMIKNAVANFTTEKVFLRLFSSWCVSSVFFWFFLNFSFLDLTNLQSVSLIMFAGVFAGAFVLLTVPTFKFNKSDYLLLPVLFAAYSVIVSLSAPGDYFFFFGFSALWAVLIYYYVSHGYTDFARQFSKRSKNVTILIIALVFTAITAFIGLIRYLTYDTPGYDFGIFSQAYYYLKGSFVPYTTCERDYFLSHFAIHFSPVLYLLLPAYAVIPSPGTLAVAQCVVLASSVIPVSLLASKYSFSNKKTVFVSFISLFMPAVICGVNYDFHENCFLYPLLLWLFWAYENKKPWLTLLFAVLVLGVKEDAAVYVVFFALYVLISRKDLKYGFPLLIGGAVYFFVVIALMTKFGSGVMTGRYSNYISGDGGLIEAVKNVLIYPAYVFTQLFRDNKSGADKVIFILQMLAPLAFIPFATKKISRLILVFPMLLINIMTIYSYQFDVGYQYAFGSAAFLLYLFIMNLSEVKNTTAKTALLIGSVICCLFVISSSVSNDIYYFKEYFGSREKYMVITQALDTVPDDASVISSSMYVSYLSRRNTVYEEEYHNDSVLTDYVVIDMRRYDETKIEEYTSLGYTVQDIASYDDSPLVAVLSK